MCPLIMMIYRESLDNVFESRLLQASFFLQTLPLDRGAIPYQCSVLLFEMSGKTNLR